MAKDATQVLRNTCSWEAWFGDVDTAAPNASTAPTTGWTSAGVIQNDPEMQAAIDAVTIKASNVCGPVLKDVIDVAYTWKLDQAQFSKLTIENWFGAGTWATSGSGEIWTPDAVASLEKAFLLEAVGSNGQAIRIYHKRASVTPTGSLAFKTNDAAILPIEVASLAPASGKQIYIYANGALDAA